MAMCHTTFYFMPILNFTLTPYKYITTQIKIEIWEKYKAKNQYQFIIFCHIAQKYKQN